MTFEEFCADIRAKRPALAERVSAAIASIVTLQEFIAEDNPERWDKIKMGFVCGYLKGGQDALIKAFGEPLQVKRDRNGDVNISPLADHLFRTLRVVMESTGYPANKPRLLQAFAETFAYKIDDVEYAWRELQEKALVRG